MMRALAVALAKLENLPPEEQERVASWLLDELEDDARWTRQFSDSQSLLTDLATEALAEHAAGCTAELDPEKL